MPKQKEPKQKCSNFCRQEPRYSSSGSFDDRIMQLQRTAGNQTFQRLIRSGDLQAKLRTGQPDGVYEHEAEKVTEQVMRMPNSVLQLKCPICNEYKRKAKEAKESPEQVTITWSHDVQPIIHEVLQSSPSQPLDPATRAFMEPRFGYDFSRVRVHTGEAAEQSAREVNAHAYTVGHNIVFDAGRLAPSTYEGERLIAHELMHVVQQSSSGQVKPTFIDRSSDHFERQADNVSTAIMNLRLSQTGMQPAMVKTLANPSVPNGVIQRKTAPDVKPVRENKARLDRLARDPREAAHRGKPDFSVTYWQPLSGLTPERLKAGGWHFLGMEITGNTAFEVGVWVNPAGNTIRRDVSTYRFSQPEKGEETSNKVSPTAKKKDVPPIEDCTELKDMTLAILRDTISTETSVKVDMEGRKAGWKR